MRRSSTSDQKASNPAFGKTIVRISSITLLLIGLASFAAVMDDSPGFSPDERVNVGLDSWFPDNRTALFDRSLYNIDRSETASLRWQDERLALELAIEAIEATPGNVFAWNAAAIAAASGGFDDFARTALARSRALAPNTARAAIQRLVLAGMELEGVSEDETGDSTRTAILHDLKLAQLYESQALATLYETAPDTAEALTRLQTGGIVGAGG